MKKLLLLLLLGVTFMSCSSNKHEKAIKTYVNNQAFGMDLKYNSKSLSYVDTVTVGQQIKKIKDSINYYYSLLGMEPISKEEFKKWRDKEFTDYRTDKDYERKVMNGELDSEWIRELRKNTRSADSLLNIYDILDPNDYELTRLRVWYVWRLYQFLEKYDLEYQLKSFYDEFTSIVPPLKARIAELEKKNPNDLYKIVAVNEYSIFNPLFNTTVDLTADVEFDKDGNIISFGIR